MKMEKTTGDYYYFIKTPLIVSTGSSSIKLFRTADDGINITFKLSASDLSIENVFSNGKHEFNTFSPETRKKLKEFIFKIIKEANNEGRRYTEKGKA